MNSGYSIRLARQGDLKNLLELLRCNGLKPTIGLTSKSLFYLAEHYDARAEADGHRLIGCTGAEVSGDAALIRSTAVLATYRKKGIAKELVDTLLQHLREAEIRKFYLFSRSVGGFWERFGFTRCEVNEVIGDLPDAPQVVAYISDSSIWSDVAWRRNICD
jgi:N-acetylglutamate synthase-like GNAT family acetyltransferase